MGLCLSTRRVFVLLLLVLVRLVLVFCVRVFSLLSGWLVAAFWGLLDVLVFVSPCSCRYWLLRFIWFTFLYMMLVGVMVYSIQWCVYGVHVVHTLLIIYAFNIPV